MLHGDGKISYENGTIIDGEFIHGVPCGRLSKNFLTSPKWFLASKCDVGNWIFSKNFGTFLEFEGGFF